jgi:hypothetical protein
MALPDWREALDIFTDLGSIEAEQVRDLMSAHAS